MNNGAIYLLFFSLSVIMTMAIERPLIVFLKSKAPQPIYEDGPSWHLTKAGTPAMGGIGFIIPITILLLIAGILYISKGDIYNGTSLIIVMLYACLNSLIGLFDDIVKIKRKSNGGLSPMQKLGLQLILAVIFLMARKFYFSDPTTLSFVFGKIDLGILYYPFALAILLGIINCANLTDGIDGLASWVAFSVAITLFICYGTKSDIGLICSVVGGGVLAFLYFNSNPAKIFMGDTGSLFLGSLAAALGFCVKNPFSSVIFGSVYVIEGISVILQVVIFKMTKKRLFRMAPIHHHLEKCGIRETGISVLGVIITIISSAICGLVIRL